MKRRTLTRKQREVLEFIENFLNNNGGGRGPFIREICDHFGFHSSATAHKYLHYLAEAGAIVLTGQSGGIQLAPDDEDGKVSVPVLGTITSAGITWTEYAGRFFQFIAS